MKETHKILLNQLNKMAADGRFGDAVRKAEEEYRQLPPGIAVLIKLILDFHQSWTSKQDEISQIQSLLCQLQIVAYREARRKNPDIASCFISSFIADYPGVPESCLILRWSSLAQSSLAFREVSYLENRLLAWQQSCRQIQSYNEFLNGLIPYLIILWRTSQGKSVNPNVFGTAYANKVEQLSSVTGGEDGAFYLFTRLAQPKIRNAIAHESIWLDSDAAKVHYTDGRELKKEYEIDLVEFLALASAGAQLCFSYLASIGVIAVMEAGNDYAKSLVPAFYTNLYNHAAEPSKPLRNHRAKNDRANRKRQKKRR